MKTSTTALTHATASKRKVNRLFTREKITAEEIKDLNKSERDHLAQTATKMLEQLKGPERDNFLNKVEEIMPPYTKSDIWEHNHQAINHAISDHMRKYGMMPAKNTIAQETGLSRQTVARHLQEYKSNPEFMAQMEQFKFMAPKMLANVYKVAGNGDMKAARLFFEMVGALNKQQGNTVVNEQKNYIQINNTIISQENIKQLTAEQLNQIENIITKQG